MENFFVDENFYSELSDFAEYLELDEEDIRLLPDDYSETAEEATLEPVFIADERFFDDMVEAIADWNIERFPDDDNRTYEKLKIALKESFDIDKLNSLMPKLYYPNGTRFKITKANLLQTI